jgi:hypothetical protein
MEPPDFAAKYATLTISFVEVGLKQVRRCFSPLGPQILIIITLSLSFLNYRLDTNWMLVCYISLRLFYALYHSMGDMLVWSVSIHISI